MCPCGIFSFSPMMGLFFKAPSTEWFVAMKSWEVITIKIIIESLTTELVFKNLFLKFCWFIQSTDSPLIFYFSLCSNVLRLLWHSLFEEVKTTEPTDRFYRRISVASERKLQIIFPFGVGDKHCQPSNWNNTKMEWFPFWSGRKLLQVMICKGVGLFAQVTPGSPYILVGSRSQ